MALASGRGTMDRFNPGYTQNAGPAYNRTAAIVCRQSQGETSMYRHILIPTDGSELAEIGVAHGLALAKSVGARVSVIYVVEPLLAVTGDFASVLDRAEKVASEAGVPCETIQVENMQ